MPYVQLKEVRKEKFVLIFDKGWYLCFFDKKEGNIQMLPIVCVPNMACDASLFVTYARFKVLPSFGCYDCIAILSKAAAA